MGRSVTLLPSFLYEVFMQLLTQDQRFQIANRMLDMIQTLLVKQTDAPSTPEVAIGVNMSQDDFKVDEFDKELGNHALSFLTIEGDEDGNR
jgi:hypothetical protein